MTDDKNDIKNCKHNAGKGYWSILPGFKCLKCGKQIVEKKLNKKLLTNTK